MHTVWLWFLVFFHWPDGAEWSNLISIPLPVLGGYFWGVQHVKRHANRHHAEHMAKLDEIHAHIKTTLPSS